MKKSLLCVLLLMFSLSIIGQANAAGISVTKAMLDYKNVLKGGYAEDFVIISTDVGFDVPLDYEVIGEIKEWVYFDPELNSSNVSIYINNAKGELIKIIIKPPVDIPAGNYSGGVRFITGNINRPGGPYGSQIQAAFLIRINIEVTGTEFMSCSIGGLMIPDTEIGKPLEFSMSVANQGNVRVRPNVSIDVWNQDQTKIVDNFYSNFNNLEVLPTTSQVFAQRFNNELRIGQYWAYATVYPCGKSELISFSVLEKGAIADYGDLLRIENQPWAKIGDIIPINAIFRNNGERTVSAKFKGVIRSNDKLVTTLDSDFFDVNPGELTNITVFFTPKKLGKYEISGRILYNNKLTFEKSSILNVNEGQEALGFNMIYIAVIIIIILLLLILIKRRRKERHHIR